MTIRLDNEWMSIDDIGNVFSVKPATVRKWIRNGKFPNGKKMPNRKRIWHRSIIERWLAKDQMSQKAINDMTVI